MLRYISAEKVNVVTLGIDIDNFKKSDYYDSNLRHELTDGGKKKILAHVGRLDKEKKIDLLIEISKELNHSEYTVMVIGGGAMGNKLKKVPAVKMMGYVSQIDVRRLLAVSDIGVLVNDIEPYGLVGLEMMAMGLPILGPDKGGLTTFLKKDFAFLCDHNKNSYLNSLGKWEDLNSEEKKIMSDNALKTVQGYTLDNMVKQLFNVYNK